MSTHQPGPDDEPGARGWVGVAATGAALDDAGLAALVAGDRVVVCRLIAPVVDRDELRHEWSVEVGELHRRAARDGWSLVPASSRPPHRLDFHIGRAGGMRTEVFRAAPGPAG